MTDVRIVIAKPGVIADVTSKSLVINSIEVLVYNTAANHYTSIPTRYHGAVTSGIIGPVMVTFTGRVILDGR